MNVEQKSLAILDEAIGIPEIGSALASNLSSRK
jgi:hypothetical protein